MTHPSDSKVFTQSCIDDKITREPVNIRTASGIVCFDTSPTPCIRFYYPQGAEMLWKYEYADDCRAEYKRLLAIDFHVLPAMVKLTPSREF